MAHVWNDKYGALYHRTYRVLYDAGIDEALADELATEHTLAAALASCERTFRFSHSETPLWMSAKARVDLCDMAARLSPNS
jgi:hypothetical protein